MSNRKKARMTAAALEQLRADWQRAAAIERLSTARLQAPRKEAS